MANKNTTTTTTTTKKSSSINSLLYLVSFVAVICVGISLLLSRVGLSGEISAVLSQVAQIISYIVLIAFSCFPCPPQVRFRR